MLMPRCRGSALVFANVGGRLMVTSLASLIFAITFSVTLLVAAVASGMITIGGGRWRVQYVPPEHPLGPSSVNFPSRPQDPDLAELLVRCRRYRRERDYLAAEVVRLRRVVREAGTAAGGESTQSRQENSDR